MATTTTREINVEELINSRPFGLRQAAIVGLCAFIALLDGLDSQAIGLAGPAIAAELNFSPGATGALFSASLAGTALGAFLLGPLADRIGRKKILIGSTLCFGIFTLLTALAGSLNEIILYRFLTGIGLGGAIPSFVSLTSEYAPARQRAVAIGLLWSGIPLGGIVGGVLASVLIPVYGWQSLFWIGGVLPILLAFVLVFALPESIGFLVNSRAAPHRIAKLLRRIFPDVVAPSDAIFILNEKRVSASIRELFVPERINRTLLLWGSFFFTFMILVMNTAWSPTLLRGEGVEISQSAIAMAMFNFGSVVGTAFAGYLVKRITPCLLLPAAFIGTAAALAGVGYAAPSILPISALQAIAGACIGVGTASLIALATILYPTSVRSTAIGWAMTVGRFGAFAGPLVIGLLLSWNWSIMAIFTAIGFPALIVALTAGVLAVWDKSNVPHAIGKDEMEDAAVL